MLGKDKGQGWEMLTPKEPELHENYRMVHKVILLEMLLKGGVFNLMLFKYPAIVIEWIGKFQMQLAKCWEGLTDRCTVSELWI